MSALLLVLVVTNGVATVRFVAPADGSYSVQASEDGLRWRVVAPLPPLKAGEHAVINEACGARCRLYRVEWRGAVVKQQ